MRVKVSGSVPPGRWPKSSMVTCATMVSASPATSRAARTASRSSSRLAKVSRISRSTSASTSASICSRKAARASANEVGPSGSMRTPSGPTAPATKARILGRFARQPHAGLVDGFQLFGHAEGGQARPAAAEGVGLQDLGAGFDVLLVNLADQVGLRKVQLIEAAIDEHAARVEHGAHGAIGHDDSAGQLIAEFLGAAAGSCVHGETSQKAASGTDIAIFPILPHGARGRGLGMRAAESPPIRGLAYGILCHMSMA